MDRTLKFTVGIFLILLVAGHLFLLSFFFAPIEKLMASVLTDDAVIISTSDIPVSVEEFLIENKIPVEGDTDFVKGVPAKVLMSLLALRADKFMDENERLAFNLNLLPYGEEMLGIGAASEYYFKKPLSEISDAQWITLVNLQKIFSN